MPFPRMHVLPIALIAVLPHAAAATRVPAANARMNVELRSEPQDESASVGVVPRDSTMYIFVEHESARGWMYVLYRSASRLVGGYVPVRSLGAAQVVEIPPSHFDEISPSRAAYSTSEFTIDAKFIEMDCSNSRDLDPCAYRVALRLKGPETFTGYVRAICKFDFQFASTKSADDVKAKIDLRSVTIPAVRGEGIAVEHVTLERQFVERYGRKLPGPPINCNQAEGRSFD